MQIVYQRTVVESISREKCLRSRLEKPDRTWRMAWKMENLKGPIAEINDVPVIDALDHRRRTSPEACEIVIL